MNPQSFRVSRPPATAPPATAPSAANPLPSLTSLVPSAEPHLITTARADRLEHRAADPHCPHGVRCRGREMGADGIRVRGHRPRAQRLHRNGPAAVSSDRRICRVGAGDLLRRRRHPGVLPRCRRPRTPVSTGTVSSPTGSISIPTGRRSACPGKWWGVRTTSCAPATPVRRSGLSPPLDPTSHLRRISRGRRDARTGMPPRGPGHWTTQLPPNALPRWGADGLSADSAMQWRHAAWRPPSHIPTWP